MKKICLAIGLALVFGMDILAGCAAEPQGNGDVALTDPAGGTEGEGPQKEAPEEGSGISALAVLDTVDVSAAFGDRDAEGWSFALKAAGNLGASYGFCLTSEISDEEKLNVECGLGVGLEDLFGIRSDDTNAFGFGLFGGGQASLVLNYRGPDGDSEPVRKSFDVGFRHDGDLIWYAGEGESETQTTLESLKTRIEEAAAAETFGRMENAFLTVPEQLQKGASLRFAVEKLIDLGFTAEIDDTNGVAVTLKAGAGFYSDLLNDMLEEFIPAKWLDYLPRADFGYERTVFDIRLAFDENGIFEEYSMSADVVLTASLEVRSLFFSESRLTFGGGLSLTANHDATGCGNDPSDA